MKEKICRECKIKFSVVPIVRVVRTFVHFGLGSIKLAETTLAGFGKGM
jgi:hypothetical protein